MRFSTRVQSQFLKLYFIGTCTYGRFYHFIYYVNAVPFETAFVKENLPNPITEKGIPVANVLE